MIASGAMTRPERIVLASGNAGKIREIGALLADLSIDVLPQSDFHLDTPEETGDTFVANALLKAKFACEATGLPALADDSGIAVDALGGRPGVFSARYAGNDASDAQNLDKLLFDMRDVADDQRAAGFHCAAVLVFPQSDVAPIIIEAVWRGRILRERVGNGGFGYDPVFLDPASGLTGAELSPEEKNKISHRGQAFRQLKDRLSAIVDSVEDI